MKLVHLGSLEACGQMMLRSYVLIFCWHKFVSPVGKLTSPSKKERMFRGMEELEIIFYEARN